MNASQLLYQVCREREEEDTTIFRRAYHWYFGGDSPHAAGQHYVAYQKNGEVPDFVHAYCNALLPKERQAELTMQMTHY